MDWSPLTLYRRKDYEKVPDCRARFRNRLIARRGLFHWEVSGE